MIDVHRREMFLNSVAASMGVTLSAANPRLEAELPTAYFAGVDFRVSFPDCRRSIVQHPEAARHDLLAGCIPGGGNDHR